MPERSEGTVIAQTMRKVGTIPLSELREGALVRMEYPPFDVLVGLVEGVPYAIEDACNHAGASLSEGGRSDMRPDCVTCPMHGYVFSLRTGALVAPMGLCDSQRTFLAKIEGDAVVVWDDFEVEIR